MSNIMKVERVRDSITKVAKLLTRDSVDIRMRGDGAHVAYNPDGSVQYVSLPNVPEDPSPEFLDAIQGFLDHEVAHILFTNHVEAMKLIKGAASEGLKADQVMMFSNVFEDIRIERNMKGQFKGSTYNLSKTLDYLIERTILAAVKSASAVEDPAKRAMERILAGFVMYARSLDGDTTCEAFIADQGLTADYIPVGLLMPTLKSRINALETTEDAVRLAIDFVKAMKEASEPGEGEGGEDKSDSEDGKKKDKADKRDNPSLGTKSDGNNDDQADPDGGDNEGDDDADDDDDWEEDESDDWDDDADEDGEGGEDQDDTEKENKGKGDPEDGDDDAGAEGDEDGGKGEDPEGEDESPEEGEDESNDEDGGGRRKGKTLKEAMKLLLPQQRNLLFDYNNRKKSVDRIAEKRGMSRASVESGLLDARRELKRIMKGE
jgi:cobaltochelatase CobT